MKKNKNVKEHFLNGRPLVAVDGVNGLTYIGREVGMNEDGKSMRLARYAVIETRDLVGFKQTRAAGDPVQLPYDAAARSKYRGAQNRRLVSDTTVDLSLDSCAVHRLG